MDLCTQCSRKPRRHGDWPGRRVIDNARYYDPLIGRFTQPDTLVPDATNPADFNRYMYVRGNPINFNDPTGHETCGRRVFDGEYQYVCWSELELASGASFENAAAPAHDPIGFCQDYCQQWQPWRVRMIEAASSTQSACVLVPEYCLAQPGTSGLGVEAELALIGRLAELPADEFYALALDAEEIGRQGLGFLSWSNDGCSNVPDSIGGSSLLGPCARHDFAYRNLKAWEEFTGEDLFNDRSQRQADDLLRDGIFAQCDPRCDWAGVVYWLGVNAWGDGTLKPWQGRWPG